MTKDDAPKATIARSRPLLDKIADATEREALGETLTVVEELERRVASCEGQLRDGAPQSAFDAGEVAELDGLANRVSMDLCTWDGSYDETTDDALADALDTYAEWARPLVRRYAAVRLRVRPDVDLADTKGIDHVSATLGLETLSRKDEHEYLIALWRPARDRARIAAGGKALETVEIVAKLEPAELRWPGDGHFEEASDNPDFGIRCTTCVSLVQADGGMIAA